MNATLEAMAQALFKSWFVDFDPVRAKQEGRQPAAMDAATAALFPDRFEESMLGEVPRGWHVRRLDDLVDVNKRSLGAGYPHATIEYIDISSVTVGTLDSTTQYVVGDAPSRARRLVQHGDTIWSTVRPNRRSYLFIDQPAPNLVVSTGFAVLTPRAVPSSYLYAWTTRDEFVEYLVANADGSAYPAVRADRFEAAPMLLPSKPVLDAFEAQAGAWRALINHNERQSRTLAAIRDALLPKLLSGEIRVKEAERLVEASV
jgi:type I restriction enzyme S subunit